MKASLSFGSCIFLLLMMKAVVNEDSSRDVIALQHEIRNLKVCLIYKCIIIYLISHVKYDAFSIVMRLL